MGRTPFQVPVFCFKSTSGGGGVAGWRRKKSDGPGVGAERWVCGVELTVSSSFVWIYNKMFMEKYKSHCGFACHSE